MLSSSTPLNGLIRLGTSDLMEDIKVMGAFKIGTNLKDNEWLLNYQNLTRRIDWGVSYYRNSQSYSVGGVYPVRGFTNLYQANISYPFDVTRSIRLTTGVRTEKFVLKSIDGPSLLEPDINSTYSVSHLEYVYDNSLNPAMNIWNGARYKIYMDYNKQVGKLQTAAGRNTFNFGFDARYYYPIFRNLIWAGRAAGDFSWGNQKLIYYLGGVDGWLMFGSNTKAGSTRQRYFNENNPPAADQEYAFQSLAVNMRGYIQNVANGNNAVTLNSEFRVPILSTFFERTINNPFLRDLQVIQFTDFGTAWNGSFTKIKRPEVTYSSTNVSVKIKSPGIGPFVGGYGFGIRSSVLGYFLKFDIGWPMDTFFGGRPIKYIALGLDF
ncbi:MAG: hypothetical protein ABIT58_06465 [Ferruginibacter sp.]